MVSFLFLPEPFASVRLLRLTRLTRVLRILRLARLAAILNRGGQAAGAIFRKRGLGYMALLTVLLTLGVGGAFVILEDEPIGVGLRTVVVTETLTDVRGEISIGPPKTRASVRTVTLPTFLVGEIEQLFGATSSPTSLLFPSPEGCPLRPSNWRRRFWAPAVEATGFEWCTHHALRHSQAALLIEAGEHPLVVARRLGHTSVKTVLDVYGHLMEGLDQGAADLNA